MQLLDLEGLIAKYSFIRTYVCLLPRRELPDRQPDTDNSLSRTGRGLSRDTTTPSSPPVISRRAPHRQVHRSRSIVMAGNVSAYTEARH